LKDTLLANNGKAAGLAANMIGVQKRIIALFVGPLPIVMLNPIIVKKLISI
jgi:peptide deformylase